MGQASVQGYDGTRVAGVQRKLQRCSCVGLQATAGAATTAPAQRKYAHCGALVPGGARERVGFFSAETAVTPVEAHNNFRVCQ